MSFQGTPYDLPKNSRGIPKEIPTSFQQDLNMLQMGFQEAPDNLPPKS
jgi:hypothetical protein